MTTPGQPTPSQTEVLAATIAGVVERQLTQYMAAMTQQLDAARRQADEQRLEMRNEFESHLRALAARIDGQDQQQRALQSALEARLAEFGGQQQRHMQELELQIMAAPAGGGGGGFDANELATLRDQIDSQSAAAHARIDELHKATRRFDEQASALVQHVNDTTIALAQRMDEGNQALAMAVEERLALVRSTLEAVGPEVQRQLTEQATSMVQRLEFTEHRVTDRMLTMEERINEQTGVKLANLEATIGRIGSGFDDAIGAMSHRLLAVENSVEESLLKLASLQEQVSKVDENAINGVKEQLSAAVGEAMLVRIELDRMGSTMNEKLDRANIRMAEIEAQLADEMDVSAAVQLERLEELERAIVALDPDQFVRKTDPGAGGTRASSNPTLGTPSPPPPSSSEPSLSSF